MKRALLTVAIAVAGVALWAPVAAASPPHLWQKCDAADPVIQCSSPRGIAANSDNGHVFVDDTVHYRVLEFDALGGFIKTWGWDVVESGPDDNGTGFEVCVFDNHDVCKAGIAGTGAGQFTNMFGLAVDSVGNLYVSEPDSAGGMRVQKFSPSGQFLLMFGKGVNSGTSGNPDVCTNGGPPSDVCGPAEKGTGSLIGGLGDTIDIDGKGTESVADDEIYVGGHDKIQVFDVEGVYQRQIAAPDEIVQSLALDLSGNLYVHFVSESAERFDIEKLGPSGEPLSPTFEVAQPDTPSAVAVDSTGHVFVFSHTRTGSGVVNNQINEFDPAGNVVDSFGEKEFSSSTGLTTNVCAGSESGNLYVTNSTSEGFLRAYGAVPIHCLRARTLPASSVEEESATVNGTVNPSGVLTGECRFEYGPAASYGQEIACAESPAQIGVGDDPVPVHTDVTGLAAGTVYHFRLLAKVDGETEKGLDEVFKTLGPPVISDEHVLGTTDTEATVRARVNPEGFATTCHLEYGPDATYGNSTADQGIGSDRTQHAFTATLSGLASDTTYHWRIACSNSSGPAGSADHILHTYRPFASETGCPNDALRSAASAFLPDCRAYEMVSPLDKNGGDILSELNGASDPGGYVQASTDGERLTYTALFAAFAGQPASFKFNQYLAHRDSSGWSNEGIHPPYTGQALLGTIPGGGREFSGFSPDLCSAWLVDLQTPALLPSGQDEAANFYRRQSCGSGAGALEALTTTPPPPDEGVQRNTSYVDRESFQGASDDSRLAFFLARAKLTDDAAPDDEDTQIYVHDRTSGDLAVVSVLPSGEAGPSDTAVGSNTGFNLKTAVSKDGSHVYWTSGIDLYGAGTIYLRLHPEQGIVKNECSKTSKACTIPISANLSTPAADAFFWAATPDGSAALYSEGEDLYEFDEETKASQLIATNVKGVAGTSDDLSRIYFVSEKAIPGSEANSVGDEAAEGEPNLYLVEGGSFGFVGTLAAGDVGAAEPGAFGTTAYDLDSGGTYSRPTRVTPAGNRIAFQSRAPLTGFDNVDAGSGRRLVEVFAYEAGGELLCISCNPSGAQPVGRELIQPYNHPYINFQNTPTKVSAAAWIPTWEQPLNPSNVLSEEGGRIFFNSNDALLPRDTNGAPDVYQWEAPGTGGCDLEDASYFPQNGGCLDLISSGESPFESEFWAADADGSDVYFTTASSLLPSDPGSIDLYDARVNGGFPQPEVKASCEGEACQSPPAPLDDPTPASSSFEGAGNVAQSGAKRCAKSKLRRRGHCKAKHHKNRKHKQRIGR